MVIRRRHVALGLGAFGALGAVRFGAGAAEFAYKFATGNPAEHHLTVRLVQALDRIKDQADGRVEIRSWSVGDIVMWDNHAAMHFAVADYDEANDTRVMIRASLLGPKRGTIVDDVRVAVAAGAA